MKSRSALVPLAIGFGILIALVAALGFFSLKTARSIYSDMETAQDAYLRIDQLRRGIATDTSLADVLVSDYLRDPTPTDRAGHRQKLTEIRDSIKQRLEVLSRAFPENNGGNLARLQKEVESYWEMVDPIFKWTPGEKETRSLEFLTQQVLPHRQAILNVGREIATMNGDNLAKERQRLQSDQESLNRFLIRIMVLAVGFGACVALITIHRVSKLEGTHARQRREIEETQHDLRKLSQGLVAAQENERRSLSRELHDEVGQMMTALGIELGNIEALKDKDPESFQSRIHDAKKLNADAMRALRNLAMGLRPSMLDDLGLEAALEWQGREFSRRTGVPATVQVSGGLENLPDAQRTCIYRIVQEALTNCARHANARKVVVAVSAQNADIAVLIEDDGVGFNTNMLDPERLGLLGIRERVASLDGSVRISSEPSRGTQIQVHIAAAGPDAVLKAAELNPDIAIVDIAMPNLNGIEATSQIVKKNPAIGVIILSMHSDETYLTRALGAGAKGYLLKENADVDLKQAITTVVLGKPFFSPVIANTLLEDYMRQLQQRGLQDSYDLLTDREKEVLQLLAEGKTNKDVAVLLNLSTNTVETHRTRIMQKLNLHSSAEIVLYAVRKKIIT
jgi:signal transduction histidine kinase/FixJ family two-component response regulator